MFCVVFIVLYSYGHVIIASEGLNFFYLYSDYMVIEQSGFSSMIQEKGQAKNIFNVIFEDP